MAATSGLVTLICNNHHQKLVNGLWDRFKAKRSVDMEVEWAGHALLVHRAVLDVFLSPEKLNRRAELGWHWVRDNQCLDALLEFVYRGKVTVAREQLADLMEAARESQFHLLVDVLEQAQAEMSAEAEEEEQQQLQLQEEEQEMSVDEVEAQMAAIHATSAPGVVLVRRADQIVHAEAIQHRMGIRLVATERVDSDEVSEHDLHCDVDDGQQEQQQEEEQQLQQEEEDNGEQEQEQDQQQQQQAENEVESLQPGMVVVPVAAGSRGEQRWRIPEAITPGGTQPRQRKKWTLRGPIPEVFTCELCQKSFTRPYHLHRHERSHRREKPYSCEYCNKSFTDSGNLARHRRIHTRVKPYKCPLCAKAFQRDEHLTSHLKSAHQIIGHLIERTGGRHKSVEGQLVEGQLVEGEIMEGEVVEGEAVDCEGQVVGVEEGEGEELVGQAVEAYVDAGGDVIIAQTSVDGDSVETSSFDLTSIVFQF